MFCFVILFFLLVGARVADAVQFTAHNSYIGRSKFLPPEVGSVNDGPRYGPNRAPRPLLLVAVPPRKIGDGVGL